MSLYPETLKISVGRTRGLFTKAEIERTQVCHVITWFSPRTQTKHFLSYQSLKITESYLVFGSYQVIKSKKKAWEKPCHPFLILLTLSNKRICSLRSCFPILNQRMAAWKAQVSPSRWRLSSAHPQGCAYMRLTQPGFCLQDGYTTAVWAVKTHQISHLNGETNILFPENQ